MHSNHSPQTRKSTNVRLKTFHWLTAFFSRVTPQLAARFAEKLFVTTTRATPPPREIAWAASATRTSVAGRQGPIAVWTWGSGERTALLVHGWSGRGLQLGAFAAPLVTRGFRVITFDAPGHGETANSTSSLPEIAGAAADVAHAFGHVDAMIAHSLGAAAALLSITREGLRSHLVLVAPAGSLSSIGQQFAEKSGFSDDVVARMRQRLERRFDFKWSEIEPLSLIERLEMPILVVHDQDDKETPWHEAKNLATTSKTNQFVSTSGLGHRRILRDPFVLRTISNFVSDASNTKVA